MLQTSEWSRKIFLAYLCYGILLINKKQWITDTHNSINVKMNILNEKSQTPRPPRKKNPNCVIPFIQNTGNSKFICIDRKQVMFLWGPAGKDIEWRNTKGHRDGACAGDGYVHCLDFGDGFMVKYIYQNVNNFII